MYDYYNSGKNLSTSNDWSRMYYDTQPTAGSPLLSTNGSGLSAKDPTNQNYYPKCLVGQQDGQTRLPL